MGKWTECEINKMVSLAKDGKTHKEISIEIDRPLRSVKTKFFQLKIKITDFKEFKKNEIKKCLNCGREIIGYNKFCNHSCAAIYNNGKRDTENICLNCGKKIENYLKYCDSECGSEHRYNEYIKNWKNGSNNGTQNGNKLLGASKYVHRYLNEKYDNKCSVCGWNKINPYTNKIPLQLEHIDGNYANNNENNLTLLCPSCHSLTPTYGGSNKGNGRKNRSQIKYGGVST